MWHGKLHPRQLVSKVSSSWTTGSCNEKCLYQIYMFYRHRCSLFFFFIGVLQVSYGLFAVFLGIWEHPEVLGGQTEVWVVPTLLFLSSTRDHVRRRINPDQPVWSSCRCSDPQVGLSLLLVNGAILWCLKFLSYSLFLEMCLFTLTFCSAGPYHWG